MLRLNIILFAQMSLWFRILRQINAADTVNYEEEDTDDLADEDQLPGPTN